MELLWPHRAATDPQTAYADDRRARVGERPWVMVNMIASLDGATAVEGRSGGLGGPADRAVFDELRSLADMIVVGAQTVRTERYGPARKPGQRIGVITASADLDWSWPLFESGSGFVITTETAPAVPVASVRTPGDRVDLRHALSQLNANVVLAEGGPRLNGDLLAEGLVDELCLTIAPKLVGGRSSRVMTSATATPSDMDLAHVASDQGYLFVRAVRRTPKAT